jgi:hypothetical protein
MKNRNTLKKSEVFKILDEVEATFRDLPKKARLAKSEDSEDEEKKKKEKEDKEKMEKCGDMTKSEGEEVKAHDDQKIQKSEQGFQAEVENLYQAMSKSEIALHAQALQKVIGFKPEPMQKSESALVEENAALRKSMDELTEKLGSFFGVNQPAEAPKSKAITGYDYIAKSEGSAPAQAQWTPELIGEKLTRLSKSSETTREDREAINEYYLGGKNVETIKHLLSNK